MHSEGSPFTWGSGGEAVFAKFCVCVRNRRLPSATVCVTAVGLSTVASASGVILAFADKVSVRVTCVAAVLLAFAEEVSV